LTVVATGLLYWHTLRYLKPVQWYGRVWFRLWRPPVDVGEPAPGLRARTGAWQRPARRTPSMLGAGRFRFLNLERPLPATDGWNDATIEKLWLYNLHYFDDLNAADAPSRELWHVALLQRWVKENPPPAGNGWEPYPTSLRIVNWVKWALSGHDLPPACVQSLALQARWLARRMEWHLMGNHLFANAKALVFAGLFFEGPEARKWLAKGLGVIASELPEQVLPDGGHFERSTMYHALFLEDLLDLVNIAAVWPAQVEAVHAAHWRKSAAQMLEWLEGLTHPDGQIAFFNDAALGIAPEPAALREYGQRLGLTVQTLQTLQALQAPQAPALQHWPDSGYVRLSSPHAVALLDVAPVGPDYLPGHAHADTLSLELSVAGQRVVVNGGTSRYGSGPERTRERSTSAHSTVEVAGQDSSEVWGGFRVARRARPFDLAVGRDSNSVSVACSHDGYRRLAGQPVHRRTWSLRTRSMTVTDAIIGGGHHVGVARFILHPAVTLNSVEDGTWTASLAGGRLLRISVGSGRAQLEVARYAFEFGKVVETQCLAVHLLEGQAVTHFGWE
jgi:uncharacterized heparinase superfamily protein